MKLRLALLATVAFSAPAIANVCAAPTSRVNNTTASGILNSYYPVVPSGANGWSTVPDITVGPALNCAECNPRNIVAGDMVLVIQPQAAVITQTNGSGYGQGGSHTTGRGLDTRGSIARFGFYRVTASSATAAAGGSITLRNGEFQPVDFNIGPGVTQDRLKSGQVILLDQVANMRLTGTVTAPPFQNGPAFVSPGSSTSGQLQPVGGIVVLDVAGTLDFNGQTIDVNGKGFRGGGGRQFTGFSNTGNSWDVANSNYVRYSPGSGTNVNNRTPGDGTSVAYAHGFKGEGIAGTPRFVNTAGVVSDNGALANTGTPDGYNGGALGRGAPGNAGGGGTDNAPTPASTGNSQNTGGGGGAGYSQGGSGGNFNGSGNPGIGGFGITPAVVSALNTAGGNNNGATNHVDGTQQMASFGGGGGAGSANDAVGNAAWAASGAAGGGIVIIRANAITGTGTVTANGANATTGPTGDAAGGGGGGGWIIMASNDQSQVTAPSLSLQARGGNGGSTTGVGNNSGPGGGGGGGATAVSANLAGAASSSVSGGAAGTAAGTSTGATAGTAGNSASFGALYHVGVGISSQPGASSRSVSSGAECVPYIKKSYSPYMAASGTTRTFTFSVSNPNGGTYPKPFGFIGGASMASDPSNNISLVDTYPAGVVNAAVPNLANNGSSNCGTNIAAVADPGTNQFTVRGLTVPGGSTCTFTMDVVATGSGILTNTIAQDAAYMRIDPNVGSQSVQSQNATPAVASLTFPAGLAAQKTSVVFSDPVNDTTNPKRIPGAAVDYTITITNNAGATVDNNTVILSDALPAEADFFAGNYAGGNTFEFTANSSGLTCSASCISYSTMASPSVSNDAHWTHVPAGVGPTFADPAIRHIRFKTLGSMVDGSSITLKYRTLVK
ncbi:hypothetical protein ACFOMD_15310 [Sphingoaurantiacus capsulatus]|uniref:DUF7933 domain-containing protein n=1 Tax=Sphingoaurantiacus capsulatus TaxID=1771310 RepID=A0ABV7XCQ3_9SPHN